MSHHPPTYSYSTDTLDVDDWLKTVIKKLKMTQCTNREMILYTTGCLEELTAEWWNAYTVAHATPNTITWQEFKDHFHVHHILSGTIKLKQREFLTLKQDNMLVNEYLDKFTQLSHYASDEVNTDPKRQEHFLDGLIGPPTINYRDTASRTSQHFWTKHRSRE
jgi:hypothetical protein